ncbi:MAG: hypothetical protein ACR2QU_00830 [Gammaproteobacteria bacterium]
MTSSERWNQRQRDVATIIWVSFLMASAATVVFFAMVDPEILDGTTAVGWQISRNAGYAIGFFMFWILTIATSVLSIFLVRSEHGAQGITSHDESDQ